MQESGRFKLARRAPRGPLSRERVLAVAAALADTEGLYVVTMRRLATDLGVEAMSLYHHLPGKDGLLDGLVDTVITEVNQEIGRLPPSPEGGDWRRELRQRCLAARQVMLRHPWAPSLIGTRSVIPFGVYLLFDEALGIMVRGGLSYHLGHQALHSLGSMLLGYVQEVFSPNSVGEGLDPAAAEAEFAQLAGGLPHIAAMVDSEVHSHDDPTLGWCDSQTEFEFTLDLLLDAFERRRTQS